MSLAPGQRLGPYEVTAPLGAGGMGAACLAPEAREAFLVPRDLDQLYVVEGLR